MTEKRYYVVKYCQDCPNVREFGYRNVTYRCAAMNEKKIRAVFTIPRWCPLKKEKNHE